MQTLFRLESLAQSAIEAGDWDLAEHTAAQMLDHDAAYGGSHLAMARVLRHKGDAAGTARELEAARRFWRDADPKVLLQLERRDANYPISTVTPLPPTCAGDGVITHRTLGDGLDVSALGLGCMPMVGSGFVHYGAATEAESIATIHRAIDLGITFFDTAEVYGPHSNEGLVGRAIRGKRDKLIIATKFGFMSSDTIAIDSSPANVKRACDGCLARLGIDYIDLFYQHRVDPKVPIEETIGAVADLVRAGKVRHAGLSEASAATLRRAAAIHPIAALQSEYSLWERGVERDILPTARALGIGFVPYSPLGRGFLTGSITNLADLPGDDYRHQDPRYEEGNLAKNLSIVEALKAVGKAHGASAAQVALAWLLAQGGDVVPIFGSKRRATLEDSAGAAGLELSAAELARLDRAAPPGATAGARYPDVYMRMVDL
jgi:aryl-alcohol dehydrogenase-like predicted oxidoreductase